jgi:hypothetical protein
MNIHLKLFRQDENKMKTLFITGTGASKEFNTLTLYEFK